MTNFGSINPEHDLISLPEAPGQDLSDWMDDIFLFEDCNWYKSDTRESVEARWDNDTGQSMVLLRIKTIKATQYSLRIMDGNAPEPITHFRYQLNGPGVMTCNTTGQLISGPSRKNEQTMLEYLHTAKAVWRNGEANKSVDKDFWSIAGHYAITSCEIIDEIKNIEQAGFDREGHSRYEILAHRIRQSYGIYDDLLYTLLDDALNNRSNEPPDTTG